MPSSRNLIILTERRCEVGLSLEEMAKCCGLTGRRSYQTAGAWERGQMKPGRQRRAKFVGYLWDTLRLREEPKMFWQVWEILVKEWHWEPISIEEARRWRLGAAVIENLTQPVAQLPIVIEMSNLIETISEKLQRVSHSHSQIDFYITINIEVQPQI